jgi:L-lactate dehydrogenase complex protein LldE
LVRVGLFIPCYVDQLAPDTGWATLEVLERAGCEVIYDPEQTCCGQPLLNLGAAREAARLARAWLGRFRDVDAVVCPSGSCVSTVRLRYPEIGVGDPAGTLGARTFELAEFLVTRLERTDVGASFPHRVALLQSCHGLRDLGLGRPSEAPGSGPPGPVERLLRAVEGLELVLPERRDECCGFGGAFSVEFPEVSARIGRDRMRRLEETGAEFMTGTDSSCLLHLDGIRRRSGHGPRPLHLAEILASGAGA